MGSLSPSLFVQLITRLIPTTNRENGPPHRVRQKKAEKPPSKFIALDPKNQWTKQLRLI